MNPQAPPNSIHRWSHDLLVVAVLAALTLAAFIDVKNCDFLNYDDTVYVTENPHVQDGLTWPDIRWAFTTTTTGNYHPLTWLSLMLDAQLSRAAPGNVAMVFHLTNLLIHLFNAILVFLVFKAMTGSHWRSALLAALFALHPLRVESVAWVSERKDVLSACLGLLALLAYAYYARHPRWRSYLLVLSLFCLSLLAKPMLVTLPCLLMLLDYWPLRRVTLGSGRVCGAERASEIPFRGEANPPFDTRLRAGSANDHHRQNANLTTPGSNSASRLGLAPLGLPYLVLLEKLPLLAVSAAACAVTFFVQRQSGSVRTTSEISLATRLGNMPIAYARYLGKLIYWGNLAVEYPYPTAWPAWQAAAAIALLLVISALALWRLRPQPWLAVGWLWFLGMLVPVIGLVQVGNQSMADRYSYLPTIGVLLMVIWSLPAILGAAPMHRLLTALAAAVVLAVLCRSTQIQVAYWENSITLMTHATEVTHDNYLAESNLAAALASAGDPQDAVDHYRQAVLLKPNLASAHDKYAIVLEQVGQIQAAADEFRQALSLNPQSPEAHNNLGQLLAGPGPLFNRPLAIEHFHQALKIRPQYPDALVNLGLALWDNNDRHQAIDLFRQAISSQPNHATAHFNLGMALVEDGKLAAGIHELRLAIQLKPQDSKFREALQNVLSVKGSGG